MIIDIVIIFRSLLVPAEVAAFSVSEKMENTWFDFRSHEVQLKAERFRVVQAASNSLCGWEAVSLFFTLQKAKVPKGYRKEDLVFDDDDTHCKRRQKAETSMRMQQQKTKPGIFFSSFFFLFVFCVLFSFVLFCFLLPFH